MLPNQLVSFVQSVVALAATGRTASALRHAACAAALTALPIAHGAELPDCKLFNAQDSNARYKPGTPSMAMQLDPASLKPGQEAVYTKDQPVLSSDVRFVETAPVLVATGDFALKSSWPMNPDWKFKRGQTIEVHRSLIGPDGRDYPVLTPERGMVLFLNPDGEFCNQTLKVRDATLIWLVGHLTRAPDDATVQWQTQGAEVVSGRLRIIYNGASAGAMHFQEVWVKGSQVVSTRDRQFDQLANEIQIGGLAFKVTEAKGDSVRLAYSFGSSVVLARNALGDMPIARLR